MWSIQNQKLCFRKSWTHYLPYYHFLGKVPYIFIFIFLCCQVAFIGCFLITLQLNRKKAWQCHITGTTRRKSPALYSVKLLPFPPLFLWVQKKYEVKKKGSAVLGAILFPPFESLLNFVTLMFLFYVLGVFVRHVALSSQARSPYFPIKKIMHGYNCRMLGKWLVASSLPSLFSRLAGSWQALLNPFWPLFLCCLLSGSHVPKPDRRVCMAEACFSGKV